jgi:hypothetical protein
MERAGERADAGRDRGEEIRRAGTDHAHGRGRAVLLVVDVQQEDEIERLGHLGHREVVLVGLGKHHVQEVVAERQLLFREDVRQALLVAIDHRHKGADLRDRDRRRQVELRRSLLEIVRRQVGVVGGQRAHERGQHRHRRSRRRKALENLLHLRLDAAFLRRRSPNSFALHLRRQFAVDRQIGRLDVIALLRELLDRITAMPEDAVVAVEEGDLALAGAGVAVALVKGDVATSSRSR